MYTNRLSVLARSHRKKLFTLPLKVTNQNKYRSVVENHRRGQTDAVMAFEYKGRELGSSHRRSTTPLGSPENDVLYCFIIRRSGRQNLVTGYR